MSRFLILNFIFDTTVAIIYPYLQLILRNKGYSFSLVGTIVAAGQIASLFIPVLFCMVTDRTRRTKTMVIVALLGSVGLLIPAALVDSIPFTLIAVLLGYGLHMAISPMIDGYESRFFKGDLSKYGLTRSMGTLGYVVSLALFGIMKYPVSTDNKSICIVMAATSALFLVAMMVTPSEAEAPKGKGGSEARVFSFKWFDKGFYIMLSIVALVNIAQSIPGSMLSSYMTEELGIGDDFALFYALGASAEFLMILFGGRILQKGKVKPLSFIMLSCVAMVLRLVIYIAFPNIVAFAFAQTLHAFTFGALHIGTMKYISQNVGKDHLSLATSLYAAIATSLPQMIGTFAGGFIIDGMGYVGLFGIYCTFPLVGLVLGIAKKRKING